MDPQFFKKYADLITEAQDMAVTDFAGNPIKSPYGTAYNYSDIPASMIYHYIKEGKVSAKVFYEWLEFHNVNYKK